MKAVDLSTTATASHMADFMMSAGPTALEPLIRSASGMIGSQALTATGEMVAVNARRRMVRRFGRISEASKASAMPDMEQPANET